MNCAKTAEPIEMLFGSWNHILHIGIYRSPWEGAILRQKLGMPRCARRHSAVSYTKMAEPIDFPLGLWTRVRRRKHKFNRIR